MSSFFLIDILRSLHNVSQVCFTLGCIVIDYAGNCVTGFFAPVMVMGPASSCSLQTFDSVPPCNGFQKDFCVSSLVQVPTVHSKGSLDVYVIEIYHGQTSCFSNVSWTIIVLGIHFSGCFVFV